MPDAPDIRIARGGQEWTDQTAALLRDISEQVIRSQGRFLMALSGGSTPQTLYRALTTPQWSGQFNWAQTFFLFGDERCIPPEHPDSNFGMAQTTLFQPLGIRSDHIYRMKGEYEDPVSAAEEYEETIRRLTRCAAPALPQIDLVLLGLGDDGHTASLFPETAALAERAKAVTIGHAPKGIRFRITLTLGVINRASVVLFLVTGSGKASVVRAVLEPQNTRDRMLPAAMVVPEGGQLIWMLDHSAAAQLTARR